MFEETKFTEPGSARRRAQHKHCRLRQIIEKDFNCLGQCPCDSPSECRFPYPQKSLPDSHIMFEDVKKYYWELYTE